MGPERNILQFIYSLPWVVGSSVVGSGVVGSGVVGSGVVGSGVVGSGVVGSGDFRSKLKYLFKVF